MRDLRFTILGSCEILGKCQNCFEIEPCAQSSFQKLNFCNSSVIKITQKQLSNFSAPVHFCSISLLSKYLIQDCLLERIFVYNFSQFLSNFNVLVFFESSKFLSNFKANIKFGNCWKVSNLTVFCEKSLMCHWKICHWKALNFVWCYFVGRKSFFWSKIGLPSRSEITIQNIDSKWRIVRQSLT